MKKLDNFENVGTTQSLPAGAYVIRILDVIDTPEREYLTVFFDIAEGPYKDFYTINAKVGKNVRSYRSSAIKFFKSFIVAVEKSNPNYKWSWDEKTLIGKYLAGEFGEEEFINDEGKICVMVKLVNFRSLQAYRDGKCETPKRKCVEIPHTDTSNIDSDVPF